MTHGGASDAKWLAGITAAALLIAVLLHMLAGPRWFSFYGTATITVLALPPFATVLHHRATAQQRRRWPIWLLFSITLAVALLQIGFWLAFFHGGPAGAELGIVRSMTRHLLALPAAIGAAVLALGWLAVVVRLYFVQPIHRGTAP